MKLSPAQLWLLPLALLVCRSEQMGLNSGPYEIHVEQMEVCEDAGTDVSHFNITLYLGGVAGSRVKKRLHRGSFTFPYSEDEVNNHLTIEANVYQRKTNDWLLMYPHVDTYCNVLLNIASDFYKSFRNAIGLPEEGCIIPVGNYTFNDWEVPFNLPTPMLEYGTYKLHINFKFDEEVVTCVTIMNVVKKKY